MAEDDDFTICPFCGNEDYSEPCEHLLADFGDLSDGDGAVLGGGFSESVIQEPAREFGRACCELLTTVWSDDDEVLTRSRKLKELTGKPGMASWWAWVVDVIDNNDVCSDDDQSLGYIVTSPVGDIIATVPEAVVTDGIQGGMTSSFATYVWGENREAANCPNIGNRRRC